MKLRHVVVLVAALCIVAVGLLGGSIGILISFGSDANDLLVASTLSVSFLVLTTGLGLTLAWHSWQAVQGQQSIAFQPKKVWLVVLIFVLAVVIGQAFLSLDLLAVVTFPLFHVAATVLPPLIVLALVGRSLGGITTWRDIVLQISSGAFLSTLLAFALEAILISGLLMVALTSVAVQPGGQELLGRLAGLLQDPVWLQDPTSLATVAQSPIIQVAALLVLAGIIPFIEEGVKALGVGLLAYRQPTLPQAFLWGLACGAGFALVEALLNTASGLESWALIILLRVGATLLHCFTGALMGLAWYRILVERQWGRGLGLYAASMTIHAIWNGLTAWMTFVSLAAIDSRTTAADQMLSGIGVLAILVLLACLTLAVGLGLAGLTAYARKGKPEASSAHL